MSLIIRKTYNSHLTSKNTTTEDMGLGAASTIIGCDRRTAYKAARRGELEVTRKMNKRGQAMYFVSKRSVFAMARRFAA